MEKKSNQGTGVRHKANVFRSAAPASGIGFARAERFSRSATQITPSTVPHGERL
jgi:hypothetical protein